MVWNAREIGESDSPVESDSPQSGSKDEDEAWPTEGTNEGIQAANETKFPQYPKTILNADPVLLQTQDPANSAEQINTPISAAQCQINFAWTPVPGRWWRLFTTRSGLGSGEPCFVFKVMKTTHWRTSGLEWRP